MEPASFFVPGAVPGGRGIQVADSGGPFRDYLFSRGTRPSAAHATAPMNGSSVTIAVHTALALRPCRRLCQIDVSAAIVTTMYATENQLSGESPNRLHPSIVTSRPYAYVSTPTNSLTT